MLQVQHEALEARAFLEAGESELVERDDRDARQRHLERARVEQRHARQREREQDELDRDPRQLAHRASP